MTFDLFVSYRRLDKEPVSRLVHCLTKKHGLRLWIDQRSIEDFDSSTTAITEGLAASRAMLVWYSARYTESRACQWELTAGYTAAARLGRAIARVLVVNPERGSDHVQPVELRDQNFAALCEDASYENAAARIASHVRQLSPQSLGDARVGVRPAWFGRSPVGSNRFVGRQVDLWRLHSGLHPTEHAIVTSDRVPVAQVRGMGGIGKTLLAEEYALRFGASYSGGIFWLNAPGPTAIGELSSSAQLAALLHDQLRTMCIELGVHLDPSANATQVRVALRNRLGELASAISGASTILWIVDDLPPGLSRADLEPWLCPHQSGVTLLTTRSREHDAAGQIVDLDVLEGEAAFALLTRERVPADACEQAAAIRLVEELGAHPLAIELAAVALKHGAGKTPFASFRNRLHNPSKDALEFAAMLVGELPTGHEASIAMTLLRSIDRLGEEGRDCLRLAAQLAALPIPSSLVVRTFAIADGDDEEQAEERASLGFQQNQHLSLCNHVLAEAESSWQVHALVGRTVLFYDQAIVRKAELSESLARALNEILQNVADVRTHQLVSLHVPHARHLIGHAQDNETTNELITLLSRHSLERGNASEASELSTLCLERRRACLGLDDPRTLQTLGDLARAAAKLRDYRLAFVLNTEVFEARRRVLGDEHVDTLTALNNLAGTLDALGLKEQGLQLHRLLLHKRMRLLGPLHEHTLFSIHNVGACLLAVDPSSEETYRYLVAAVWGRTLVQGSDHLNTLVAKASLAACSMARKNLEETESLLGDVVTGRLRLLPTRNRDTLSQLASWAALLIQSGKPTEAITALLPVMHEAELVAAGDVGLPALLANNLARAYAAIGSFGPARYWQEMAVAKQRNADPSRPGHMTRFAYNLFELLMRVGDQRAARSVFDKNLAWLPAADPESLNLERRHDRSRLVALLHTHVASSD